MVQRITPTLISALPEKKKKPRIIRTKKTGGMAAKLKKLAKGGGVASYHACARSHGCGKKNKGNKPPPCPMKKKSRGSGSGSGTQGQQTTAKRLHKMEKKVKRQGGKDKAEWLSF